MRTGNLGRTALGVFVCLWATTSPTLAGPGPKGHAHAMFNAGSPGDAKKPFRIVEIIATETKDGMRFEPAKIVAEQGEQIKFSIKNVGELAHEFMLDSVAANQKHAIAMQKNPEMEHDDPNGKRMEPKKASELVWKFTKLGSFEYACLIPGHYESGMKGIVEVVPKQKTVPQVAAAAKTVPPAKLARKAAPASTAKQ